MQTANNPGYKTTEFYLSAASMIIGVLLMLGLIKPQQAQALNDQVPTIMGAILTLVMAASYVLTRFGLKRTAVLAPAEPDLTSEPAPSPAPDPAVTQPAIAATPSAATPAPSAI